MLRLLRTLGSIVLLAGLAVLLIAQEDGCNSDENGEEADGGSGASSESIEYKLAVIDQGSFVETDDPLVRQFKSALDALTPKCTETRQKVADMGVVAHGLLEEKGITLSLLRVMQDVNRSIPSDFGTQPCADIFAAYVVLQ